MDAHVLCHRLKFPKRYSPANFPEPQTLGLSRTAGTNGCEYGVLRCGNPSLDIAYVCYNCNKIFTSLNAIQNHVLNECEKPSAVLLCEHCDKRFLKKLISEYIIHRDLKHSMECNVCEKSFVTEDELLHHRKSQHPDITFYYKCDLCRFGFPSKAKLENHYAEHRRQEEEASGEMKAKRKQYRCAYCRELCFGLKGLAAHYRHHQDLKRLAEEKRIAEEVERLAERKRQKKRMKKKIKNHALKSAEGERLAYEGERSADEGEGGSNLKKTKFGCLSLGYNTKLYVCYLCNRYFNQESELADHKKIHTDRPTPSKLKKREKMIHLYKCKTCDLLFVKRSQRRKHKTKCVRSKV